MTGPFEQRLSQLTTPGDNAAQRRKIVITVATTACVEIIERAAELNRIHVDDLADAVVLRLAERFGQPHRQPDSR